MKKWKKILLAIFIGIVVVAVGGLGYLKSQTYSPATAAQQTADKAEQAKDWLYFPSKDTSKPMVLFYPGALVAPESYSVWAKELANAGYPVYILKMPLDLAVLAPDRGGKILEKQSDRPYVIGGHSLGGVMASRFAANHSKNLSGVFFLASYPDEKGSLADKSLPVLSLTGENDHVLNHDAYEKAKDDLPKNTDYQEIAGGNHGGFGDYGQQKGDGKSEITNQNEQVAKRVITWLNDKVN